MPFSPVSPASCSHSYTANRKNEYAPFQGAAQADRNFWMPRASSAPTGFEITRSFHSAVALRPPQALSCMFFACTKHGRIMSVTGNTRSLNFIGAIPTTSLPLAEDETAIARQCQRVFSQTDVFQRKPIMPASIAGLFRSVSILLLAYHSDIRPAYRTSRCCHRQHCVWHRDVFLRVPMRRSSFLEHIERNCLTICYQTSFETNCPARRAKTN